MIVLKILAVIWTVIALIVACMIGSYLCVSTQYSRMLTLKYKITQIVKAAQQIDESNVNRKMYVEKMLAEDGYVLDEWTNCLVEASVWEVKNAN